MAASSGAEPRGGTEPGGAGEVPEGALISVPDACRLLGVHRNTLYLLIREGEYRKAFDAAAEAAQRNPEDARNFLLAGKALARLDAEEVSIKWLTQAVALDPTLPEPHYLLAMKCAAMRLGEEFHDLDDVRYLLRHLDISSVEQALAVVTRYFSAEQLAPKTRLALEELLPRRP